MSTTVPTGFPALPLAQVVDTDCVVSQSPLVIGRRPGVYVRGAQAILRRILYAWCVPAGSVPYDLNFGCGLLGYDGTTLSPGQVLGLRRRLETAAVAEDYVLSAQALVTFANNILTVRGNVVLVDGRAYPLEVSIGNAAAALDALGL